jgi:hypothetical protein
MNSWKRVRSAGAATAAAGLALVVVSTLGASPLTPKIAAASAHDPNPGDVWLDNVGQPPGPGHEHDPHLACADIYLWGNGLADSSGTFVIDGWHPSGSGTGDYTKPGYQQDQAWPNTTADPGAAAWQYDTNHRGRPDHRRGHHRRQQ